MHPSNVSSFYNEWGNLGAKFHSRLAAKVFEFFVQGKITAAHADGYISASVLQDDDQLESLDQWKETRFNADQRYVGLSSVSNRYAVCRLICRITTIIHRNALAEEYTLVHLTEHYA